MNVSLSASGTPSQVKRAVESQLRTAGDSNPAARSTLRSIGNYIDSCIDDGADSVTVSGSFGAYIGNSMPDLPEPKAPGQAAEGEPAIGDGDAE